MIGRYGLRSSLALTGCAVGLSILAVFADPLPGMVGIHVRPETALLGTPVHVLVSGLRAGEVVTVRNRSDDGSGRTWGAAAEFVADSNGRVDCARHAPQSGSYAGIDPAGLFWSMKPAAAAAEERTPSYSFKGLDGMTMQISVERAGQTLAVARGRRLIELPESPLVREPVRSQGVVATLYHPASDGSHPGLILVGGSGGGLPSTVQAGLLASHGFTVLALAYFGIDPLPGEPVEIPLEYFAGALKWFKEQKTVKAGPIAVMGGSLGGELALLLGSEFPDIKAVVAIAPSGVVWQGISKSPFPPKSSWSRNGVGLPFAPFKPTPEGFQNLMAKKPVAFKEWYDPAKQTEETIQKATIPVEKINGPVLLISGSDDQMWPSDTFAELVMRRLEMHRHGYPARHLSYAGAGHSYSYPYFPTSSSQSAGTYIVGGNPRDDARAVTESWPILLAFLHENLRTRSPGGHHAESDAPRRRAER